MLALTGFGTLMCLNVRHVRDAAQPPRQADDGASVVLGALAAPAPAGRADPEPLTARLDARVSASLADRIETWRSEQHPIPSKAEAVRVLIGRALDADDRAAAEPYEPERR